MSVDEGRQHDGDGPTPPAGEANGDAGSGGGGVPERIGAYKILSVLGEGGFGVVYLAEQTEPVHRRAALKLIKPGMDSRAVIGRFEAERQALAMMDHPNVARVLDAGTTERGLPYFVMEHVAGVPITDYVERARLGLRAKLELFMQVCGAVQHAHQKGVMHRDIKPSNILVEYVDGRASPKVIDFGVAKALSQPLTETPVHTQAGQFLGTPEYMSPEQAEGTSMDVDTRSDVYSLGVVLYQVLTGMLPFDGERLRRSGQAEIVRTLREEEPRKPSTRLSEVLSSHGSEMTPARRTLLRTLASRLRGDLDWIVMRCLEKDRSRRYATPSGLAKDIQRYLSDEPVLAGPPSAAYRVRKFVRRHRAGVTAAALVVAVLVLGMVGTTTAYLRAVEARRAEARQREEAEKAFAFMSDAFISPVAPEQMGADVTMREVLDAAEPQIDAHFAGMPLAEAGVRMTFGETYLKLGAYDAAREQFERVCEIRTAVLGASHPQTLEALDGQAHVLLRLGRLDDAEPIIRAALDGRERVMGERHEDTLVTMTKDAALHYLRWSQHPDRASAEAQAELAEATDVSRRVYEVRADVSGDDDTETLIAAQNLAAMLQAQGRPGEAEELLLTILERARSAHGERAGITLRITHRLGGLYLDTGDHERAISLLEAALRGRRAVFLDDHPQTLTSLRVLGDAYERARRSEDAIALMEEVLESAWARGAAHREARLSMEALVRRLESAGLEEDAARWRARLEELEMASSGRGVAGGD